MKRRFRYDRATDSVVEVGKAPARGGNDWKKLSCESMGYDGTLENAYHIDRMLGAPYVDYEKVDEDAYNPVFHDKSTYNRWLKAHGMVNRTSGKGGHSVGVRMIQQAIERMKSLDTPSALEQ